MFFFSSKKDGTNGAFKSLSLTYAACNADLTAACMWTAVYNLNENDLPSLGLGSTCTTGGPQGGTENGLAYDENNMVIPNQRSPSLAFNSFANSPRKDAPFTPGQCLTPVTPVDGIYRSFMVRAEGR
jgi:hypothetical protein